MKKRVIIIFIVLLVVIIAGVFYFNKNEDAKDTRCYLESVPVVCNAAFERYYFDSESGLCEKFIWGGCGEVVPFETMQECQNSCE